MLDYFDLDGKCKHYAFHYSALRGEHDGNGQYPRQKGHCSIEAQFRESVSGRHVNPSVYSPNQEFHGKLNLPDNAVCTSSDHRSDVGA